MFTGIVQGKGKLIKVERKAKDARFFIQCDFFKDLKIGESIAINGVCLSVEELVGNAFRVFASSETLSKTNLGFLKPMDEVNVERAIQTGDRFGGHFVTGHVDCMSEVEKINKIGESYRFRFRFPGKFSCFVVPKGSIALDGISLTVNDCGENFFEVNIIPVTYRETTISSWRVGRLVNTEFDIVGKYVIKAFETYRGLKDSSISLDFLKRHGFV